MTDVERKLWLRLREQRLNFRRQAPIGRYIVDFAQHGCRLVVELDGGQHNEIEAQAYDAERSAWLQSRGYRVLRFWNSEVNDNLEGVVETIVRAVLPPPQPSPVKGEGVQCAPSPSPFTGEGHLSSPSPFTGEGRGGGARRGEGA